jgi:hypothetical protein
MKINVEIILTHVNEDNAGMHSALSLDSEDPNLLEKIKDHLQIFKNTLGKVS